MKPLTPQEYQAFMLFTLFGLSYRQTAKMMGVCKSRIVYLNDCATTKVLAMLDKENEDGRSQGSASGDKVVRVQ